MGLDKPIGMQFVYFMKHLFFGDQYGWPGFGKSFTLREPLRPILIERMFITLQLALGAAVMWLLIGIPIGVLSALRPRSLFDRAAMGFALVGISIPVFVLGPMALWVFSYQTHLLPGTGYRSLLEYGFWPWFSHFLLPWFVLALLYAAFYARLSQRQPARHDGRGLHAHRAGQGPSRATGDRAPRAALQPHAVGHGLRSGPRRPAGRCGHHGDDLQHPRASGIWRSNRSRARTSTRSWT